MLSHWHWHADRGGHGLRAAADPPPGWARGAAAAARRAPRWSGPGRTPSHWHGGLVMVPPPKYYSKYRLDGFLSSQFQSRHAGPATARADHSYAADIKKSQLFIVLNMPIDQRIDGILGLLREEFEKGASASREVEHLQGQIRTQVRAHSFFQAVGTCSN
jgi:hypothetical protein